MYLVNKIETVDFNFDNLTLGMNDVGSNYSNEIQYGKIFFENGESVKFWFVSHHNVNDYGGAIYEYENGETQFCYGYHCCEVQFPNSSNTNFSFTSVNDFKKFISETDGIQP